MLYEYPFNNKARWNGGFSYANSQDRKLCMQGDGHLCLYEGNKFLWGSKTAGQGNPPYKLILQGDGNLVLYDGVGKGLWDTKTAQKTLGTCLAKQPTCPPV